MVGQPWKVQQPLRVEQPPKPCPRVEQPTPTPLKAEQLPQGRTAPEGAA